MPILDRRIPTDWAHIEKHPMRAAPPALVALTVERILDIPRQYRDEYNQGQEGACVGFSQSWMMSILNRKLYSARRLYQEAQLVDEWADTPPAEGTSVRAGFDILRDKGHWRMYAQKERPVELDEGISANRWALTVDDIRTAISVGIPVNLGINWYQEFSTPVKWMRDALRFDYYIGVSSYWGRVAGGHAITCVGASDTRQALALCNTWGTTYPFIVWLPYRSMERLFSEYGEAGVVVDR